MDEVELTAEQELEALHLQELLQAKANVELRRVARLLVSKRDRELFGDTEFQVREALFRIGADAYETALAERKKRGTSGRARTVRNAGRQPASRATGPAT